MQVLPPGRTGGPSRLFIMRPVATTLLMVDILLAGIIGYRSLLRFAFCKREDVLREAAARLARLSSP